MVIAALPLTVVAVLLCLCCSLVPPCADVSGTINAAYGSRCYNSPLGESLFAAGRLGQKTGAGYYKYVKGKPVADPTLVPLIEAARAQAKAKAAVDAAKLSDDELAEATLFPGK